MIKKFNINTYEYLGETSINIECGTFSRYGLEEVIKAIVEAINLGEDKSKKDK